MVAIVPATLGEMLTSSARRFGRKPFLVCADRTLSFEEVDELASNVALNLSRLGIRAGDVVTLWMENGWRWVAAYYGALRLGAVVNPVNILLTAQEVDFIARDCGAKVLIAGADKARGLPGDFRVPVITDAPCTGNGDESFDSLVAPTVAGVSPFPRAALSPESRAAICYTSGTTGYPKGAVLRHRSVLTNTSMTALMHGRSAGDTVVSALPCPHVYGNIVLNTAVACGMTLVLLPRFEEHTVLEAIHRNRATLFEGVPTMFMKLLNDAGLVRSDLSSLRLCTVGGQTMPVATMEEVERRFGCPLIELWGMTEIGGLGTTHPHNGPRRLGSIGVPLPLSEAKVADVDDAGRVLARGEVGELMIRGPLVMDGYFNNPDATREAIEPDGWLHTGDLVRQDEDGYYFVVDRKKEVIISGGYNVYPAEVERVIAQHPAVAMVAVAAASDELKGQVPKAFVVLRGGASCTADSIIAHCRTQLASYKRPAAVEFLDDLPKTSTGKILRRALAGQPVRTPRGQ